MAGPWEKYGSLSAPEQPAGPWSKYQPQEFAPELNTVIDDPARAAPMRVQAGASLRTRPAEQIKIYSDAMGIPADRFGTLDGQIVYRDDKDQLVRVSPSLTGATGAGDAVQRLGSVAARNAGEAVPAAASALATVGKAVPPTSFATIPLAGALGAAGEAGRQLLGDSIYGARPGGFDYLNVAAQGGMAALGQGAGLGFGKLIERNPAGVIAPADRAFFRDPANKVATQKLSTDAQAEGVTLLNGDVTNRSSLLARDRQLGRFADTADDMGKVAARRNAVEIPNAINRRINDDVAALSSTEGGRASFSQAASDVINKAWEKLQDTASPLFEQAWQAKPGPVWSENLEKLMQRPAIVQAWKEAQVNAANRGRELPNLFKVSQDGNRLTLTDVAVQPDMKALHEMKMALDKIVQGGADPVTGAVRLPAGGAVRSALNDLKNELTAINPVYGEALAKSKPLYQAFADLEATGIAREANRTGNGSAHEGLAAIFDGGRMAPERVAEYRMAFKDAGKEEEWQKGLAAYLRHQADQAMQTVQRGAAPSNPAGKFYQSVFGTEQRKNAIAAAMGGANTPEFVAFNRTMDILQAASRSLPEGSPTATDIGGRAGFADGWKKALGNVIGVVTAPWNVGRRVEEGLIESSAGSNARALAQGYLAGPQNNGAFLAQQRLLPNSVAGLMLPEAGQLGAFGLGGLLGAPADAPPAKRGLLGR